MKAGREMDVTVAEKIMGWQDYMPPNTYAIRLLPLGMAATWGTGEGRHGIPLAKPEDPRDGARAAYVPYYSTDIAAAWQVVEQLHTRDIDLMMGQWSSGWAVVPMGDGDWDCLPGFVQAETAPEAICLAALKAVGVELGDED